MALKIKVLLTFLVFVNSSLAVNIEPLFKRKRYADIYEAYKGRETWKSLTTRELIMLSHSMRVLKKYRDDIRVAAYIIRKDYHKQHTDIQRKIKLKETLDMDDYPKSMPILYWYIYNDYAAILQQYDKMNSKLEKDRSVYLVFRQILSELEFREGKVERTNDKVIEHVQTLQKKIYRFSSSMNLQYVSWQHDFTLERASTGKSTGLVVTNRGYCLGGDVGIENGFYHFFLDGCLLIGEGGVSAYGDSNIDYEQKVPAWGVKLGPQVAMIVSSSKSQIGIGFPVIFTKQDLSQPPDPDYQIKEESPWSFLPTINSRWQFGKWYLRTEFGQYLQRQESFWGVGVGREF